MDERKDLYDNMVRNTLSLPFYKRARGFKKIMAYFDFLLSVRQQRNRFYYKCIRCSKVKGEVLDVGCGGGNRIFKELGRTTGVDFSFNNLLKAKSSYEYCIQTDLIRGLPFQSKKFDYVVCNDVLGHFSDNDRDYILNEAWRVLKDDGRFIAVIETYNLEYDKYKTKFPDWFPKLMNEAIDSKGHIGLELPRKALNRLKKIGFEILDYRILSFNPGYVQGYIAPLAKKYPSRNKLHAIAKYLSNYAYKYWILERILDNIFGLINYFNKIRLDMDYNGGGIMVLCEKGENELIEQGICEVSH